MGGRAGVVGGRVSGRGRRVVRAGAQKGLAGFEMAVPHFPRARFLRILDALLVQKARRMGLGHREIRTRPEHGGSADGRIVAHAVVEIHRRRWTGRIPLGRCVPAPRPCVPRPVGRRRRVRHQAWRMADRGVGRGAGRLDRLEILSAPEVHPQPARGAHRARGPEAAAPGRIHPRSAHGRGVRQPKARKFPARSGSTGKNWKRGTKRSRATAT